MFEPDSKSYNELLEKIAEVFHDAWVSWSKELSEKEVLSEERRERSDFWYPYSELDDKEKERDRVWARKAMSATVVVAQAKFEKWARNLERRLKKK